MLFSRGSAWPWDQICISCIGRQILYQRSPRFITYLSLFPTRGRPRRGTSSCTALSAVPLCRLRVGFFSFLQGTRWMYWTQMRPGSCKTWFQTYQPFPLPASNSYRLLRTCEVPCAHLGACSFSYYYSWSWLQPWKIHLFKLSPWSQPYLSGCSTFSLVPFLPSLLSSPWARKRVFCNQVLPSSVHNLYSSHLPQIKELFTGTQDPCAVTLSSPISYLSSRLCSSHMGADPRLCQAHSHLLPHTCDPCDLECSP